MVKINKKWKDVKGIKVDDFITLTPGGHLTEIIEILEHKNKKGEPSLKVLVNVIEEGRFKDCFLKQFLKDEEKGWPNGGIKYVPLKEDCLPYFKGFIEALEESNGIKIKINEENLDLKQFKGLKVACQFRLEFYRDKDGVVKKGLSISGFEDIHKLDSIKIPDVKYLDRYIPYEEYKKSEID